MPKYLGPQVPTNHANSYLNGAGTPYLIQTPAGVVYRVHSSLDTNDLHFSKTSDGITWSTPVALFTGSVVAVSVWYDRWSNISAGLIHVAYSESTNDDTLYRTIDTENSDALSTETVIFAGASTASGGMLSITRAVGGNVYCRTCIDAGVEGGFYRLPNANVPSGAWDAARTDNEALATQDQMILLPDLNSADNQDILGIFWDADANEISRQNYDDSANSWAETSISTGMTDTVAANSSFPHFAAAVDLTNSQHVLIAWSAVDTLNADLMCWTVDATTITAKTDVVTNSTDDQGLAAIGIDTATGDWYAFYAGKTDGSETFSTAVNLYMKVSQDDGTTWGDETQISTEAQRIRGLYCTPRFNARWSACTYTAADEIDHAYTPYAQPRAQVVLGV